MSLSLASRNVLDDLLSRVLGRCDWDWRAFASRRPAHNVISPLEVLEDRTVLSGLASQGSGAVFLNSLSNAGVIVAVVGLPTGQAVPGSQLARDLQKLQADVSAMAAKSSVTVLDLSNLVNDAEAIFAAGLRLNARDVQDSVGALAIAVAAGTDTSAARASFDALFAGSSVSQSLIDTTYAHLVQTIQDSHVTAIDLATIAADILAVENDLGGRLRGVPSLGLGFPGGGGGGGFMSTFDGSLQSVGVPSGMFGGDFSAGSGFFDHWVKQGLSTNELTRDIKRLTDDEFALIARSDITILDLNNLMNDAQSIHAAGARIDRQGLDQAIGQLAVAVAGGADTSAPRTTFLALFSGSKVAQSTIDGTYTHLVQTIQDSRVTSSDLATIAADRTSIRDDLLALQSLGNSTQAAASPATTTTATMTTTMSGGGSSGSTSHHRSVGSGKFRGFSRRRGH